MDARRVFDMRVLTGEVIVLDLSSPFVIVGRLVAEDAEYLVLDDADAHDLRDTAITREKYVRNCREHGINPNRRRIWTNRREVVSLSRLEDVLID